MIFRLVRAELIKLNGAPSTWWLAAFAHVAVVFGIVLTLAMVEVRTHADVLSVMSFSGVGGEVLLLLGLVWTAGMYRHRTIVSTMLYAPRRAPSFVAQLLALTLVGVVVGLSAAALAVVLTVAWLGLADIPVSLSAAEITRSWLGGALYSGLAAALGGGLGALARNQVAAAIAIFLYLGMADPLIGMAVPAYGQFAPTSLGTALSGGAEVAGPGAQLLPYGTAAAVWAGYTLVLATAGLIATVRRDLR